MRPNIAAIRPPGSLSCLLAQDFNIFLPLQLLQAKYPTAGIILVEGTGGDQGIDNFQEASLTHLAV